MCLWDDQEVFMERVIGLIYRTFAQPECVNKSVRAIHFKCRSLKLRRNIRAVLNKEIIITLSAISRQEFKGVVSVKLNVEFKLRTNENISF